MGPLLSVAFFGMNLASSANMFVPPMLAVSMSSSGDPSKVKSKQNSAAFVGIETGIQMRGRSDPSAISWIHKLRLTSLSAFIPIACGVALQQRLRPLAPGLTPRQALEQLAGIQMLDVEIPTTDDRLLRLTLHTQPDEAVALLIQRLGKGLPDQPPPKLITPEKLDIQKGVL